MSQYEDNASEKVFGQRIKKIPSTLDGTMVVARFIDGLAFRYYWATEGLREEDLSFRPGPGCKSTIELQEHILYLVRMIQQAVLNTEKYEAVNLDDPVVFRAQTLNILKSVRTHLERLDDISFSQQGVLMHDGSLWPIWNVMNGPISDALTHVGQINAWRRLSGNPTKPVNVFAGLPPV